MTHSSWKTLWYTKIQMLIPLIICHSKELGIWMMNRSSSLEGIYILHIYSWQNDMYLICTLILIKNI